MSIDEKISDMTWTALLTRCRKDALWSANRLVVMDKRLETLETEIFNQRRSTRAAAKQCSDIDHALARLQDAMQMHLARCKPLTPGKRK